MCAISSFERSFPSASTLSNRIALSFRGNVLCLHSVAMIRSCNSWLLLGVLTLGIDSMPAFVILMVPLERDVTSLSSLSCDLAYEKLCPPVLMRPSVSPKNFTVGLVMPIACISASDCKTLCFVSSTLLCLGGMVIVTASMKLIITGRLNEIFDRSEDYKLSLLSQNRVFILHPYTISSLHIVEQGMTKCWSCL